MPIHPTIDPVIGYVIGIHFRGKNPADAFCACRVLREQIDLQASMDLFAKAGFPCSYVSNRISPDNLRVEAYLCASEGHGADDLARARAFAQSHGFFPLDGNRHAAEVCRFAHGAQQAMQEVFDLRSSLSGPEAGKQTAARSSAPAL